jgi:YebC/PmpR family DNA-binding regulatory protein
MRTFRFVRRGVYRVSCSAVLPARRPGALEPSKGLEKMSGHSKWATTKHRKAAVDAKRSALFSKLSRVITVAARTGGDPSPENNASLAAAIAKAKGYSLPKDKIKTAIDKAFAAGAGANYEEVIYEGYGSGGVAIYVEALTDNRNRTAADVRSAFTRAGGSLGATGSVAFQFERKGQILVEKTAASDEDELMLLVADAGGEDLEDGGEEWVVYTGPSDLATVSKALEAAGVAVKGAELVMEATTPTAITVEDAKKVMRLVDKLEESDDIQNVYTTMDLTDEIAAALDA